MKTETLLETSTEAISTRHMLHYFLWILILDFLFFSESFGLNALVATLITVPMFLIQRHHLLKSVHWWQALLVWLLAAVGVFINGHGISIFAYFVAFFHFAAVSSNVKLSVANSLIQTIPSFIMGMIAFFTRCASFFKADQGLRNKWLVNFLMISIPFTIILIFLKLYQAADKDFNDLTAFLNLDFISWGSILLYLLLSVFLFGFIFYQHVNDLNEIENKLSNDISQDREDRIQKFFGIANEARIATILLVGLNLMLILYNVLDLKFIFTEMHDPESNATLSEIVHAGIYALIFSIVLVIFIVTYLFRGQLNFQHNRVLKPLVIFWLVLNLLMVITTSIKNWEYVEFWGLTYKRMGVFVYLLLATFGLAITFYKVINKRSFWFVLRKTSVVFAVSLTSLLTFNWNRVIALYNTNYIAAHRIDFNYLYELGPDTYTFILDYHQQHGTVNQEVILGITQNIPFELDELSRHQDASSWKSYVWSDLQLMSELEKYKIIAE